jgi:predicted site-specific integrase-resolvase
MFRVCLYARVSTNDQQTLPMQNRAMRAYAARRDWTITMQVREVGSGTTQRESREKRWRRHVAALPKTHSTSAIAILNENAQPRIVIIEPNALVTLVDGYAEANGFVRVRCEDKILSIFAG